MGNDLGWELMALVADEAAYAALLRHKPLIKSYRDIALFVPLILSLFRMNPAGHIPPG